jgi:hypothetical protein
VWVGLGMGVCEDEVVEWATCLTCSCSVCLVLVLLVAWISSW